MLPPTPAPSGLATGLGTASTLAGIYRLINPAPINIKVNKRNMSRTLKRPMFRKGGEVMEGIMTGIKPREIFCRKRYIMKQTNELEKC